MALGGGMLPDNVGSESSPARSWSGKHKSRAEQNQLRVCHLHTTSECSCALMNQLQMSVIDLLKSYGIILDHFTPASQLASQADRPRVLTRNSL